MCSISCYIFEFFPQPQLPILPSPRPRVHHPYQTAINHIIYCNYALNRIDLLLQNSSIASRKLNPPAKDHPPVFCCWRSRRPVSALPEKEEEPTHRTRELLMYLFLKKDATYPSRGKKSCLSFSSTTTPHHHYSTTTIDWLTDWPNRTDRTDLSNYHTIPPCIHSSLIMEQSLNCHHWLGVWDHFIFTPYFDCYSYVVFTRKRPCNFQNIC